ncbi:MAG: hypothetical protein Q9217_004827 [Psora testacea]
MRLVWVPQWTVLPVIVEDRVMVDDDAQRGRVSTTAGQTPDTRARAGEHNDSSAASYLPGGNTPYEFHVQGATPQQQSPSGQPFNLPGQHDPAYVMGRGQSPAAFNMSNMAGALPEPQNRSTSQTPHHEVQRYSGGMGGSMGGTSQYASQHFQGQPPLGPGNYPIHPSQYAGSYQEAAAAAQAFAQMQAAQRTYSSGPNPMQSSYPSGPYFQNTQQQYLYYPGQYGHAGQPAGHAPFNQGFGQYGAEVASRPFHSGYPAGGNNAGQVLRSGLPTASRESSNCSSVSIPSTPRGPPRKPKQSGHALWVGNLPSGTLVADLKDHFSRDATKYIESVFLISKSNCAFVNYRSEAACVAAMNRFHDSRFQGVRLVCRLRRSPAVTSPIGGSASGVPTGPAALMPDVAATQTAFEAIAQNRQVSSKAQEEASTEASRRGEHPAKVSDKYFIMKSLTVEDMELSVRNKIWATQAHNEDALNKAYETADNVYLIYSANKSGEYFGFARMASPINEEASANLDWAPRGQTVIDDPDIPRSIPTPATEFAPKGCIIDDSARGTIFWEADPEDENLSGMADGEVEHPGETAVEAEKVEEADETALSGDAHAFGKPFKIEWLATNRLPFYRTRGLRNPWNANREVKIARDGTELETSVGRRLIQMFSHGPIALDPRLPANYPQTRQHQ